MSMQFPGSAEVEAVAISRVVLTFQVVRAVPLTFEGARKYTRLRPA